MAGTQRRYAKATEELLAAMTSTSFSTLERFPQRKMVLGEAQPVFLHDLEQLLEQAMSGLDSSISQLRSTSCYTGCGRPSLGKQLRATGSTTELRTTYGRKREAIDLAGERAALKISK